METILDKHLSVFKFLIRWTKKLFLVKLWRPLKKHGKNTKFPKDLTVKLVFVYCSDRRSDRRRSFRWEQHLFYMQWSILRFWTSCFQNSLICILTHDMWNWNRKPNCLNVDNQWLVTVTTRTTRIKLCSERFCRTSDQMLLDVSRHVAVFILTSCSGLEIITVWI